MSAAGGSNWTDLVADTNSTGTNYSHTGLSAGATRHYRVSAINDAGTGLPSGVVGATTAAADALVSNTGQTGDPDVIEAIGDQDGTHSQGFETGSNPGGYRLSSVGVYVSDADLGAGEAFTAHIHAADGAGGLGAVAYTLTSPGSYTANAVNVFTAPAGAALEADTAYHVVFEGAGDAATDFVLGVSASDGEDSGSRLGWEIEDGRRFQGGVVVGGGNYRISVNGAALPTEVPADWDLVPAGLNAGDTFRLLFLSSTGRDATSSDIEDYNAFVQNLAAAGHAEIREYSAGFRVVGCTEATDARDNTDTIHTSSDQEVAIYWLGGNRVADDYGDFYDGSWDDEANDRDESGANGPDTSVAANHPWTGCKHNGTASLALGQNNVRLGRPNSAGSSNGPINGNSIATNSGTRPMYGVSELFQVGAVGVPGVPTGLTATADGETGIDLSWTAPADNGGADITGYRIEVSEDGGSAWADRVADTESADRTHPHTGLSAGSTRHYRVSAINPVGTGVPSGVVYTTTVLSDALVSNTGQSGDPDVTEAIGDQDGTHSQGFETGSNPGGYRLASVGVYVADADLGAGEAFTAHIHAADGAGGLGAVAYTLTSPGSYTANAVNVFTAPAGAALDADTAYHVVFEGTGDAATDFVLGVSASDGEDGGSRAGWEIEDGRRFEGGVAVAGTNFQVSVNGSAIPTKVYADWGLIPAGLGVGDTFRLLFLSSTKRDATSPDIEDYNAFVQGLAAAGHADIREYGAGFRVVGCTRATDARDNTRTIHTASNQGVPIYWLGGNRVADDYEDFYDGDWDEEANDKDESGNNGPDTSQSANFPFTGCRHNGTGESLGRALGNSGQIRVGRPNSTNVGDGPIHGSYTTGASETRPMYGLSELFRVSASTAPGAPTGLTATADGETGIDLSWTAPGRRR